MSDNSKLTSIRENYIINSIKLLDKIKDYIAKEYDVYFYKKITSVILYIDEFFNS